MRVAVVGGGGFLGTNLMEALDDAVCIEAGDKLDFTGCDAVIHLAANADVRNGWDHPTRDLLSNTVFTSTLLEAMRHQHVRRLLFASTSSVYGNAPIPTPETYSGQQTSLYGASKLACEGLIGAYAEAGHISATILRLTSMLGPHYRHGLVKDFVEQIQKDGHVQIFGGGNIQRTRMDVSDGVSAFLQCLDADPGYEVFNVSRPDTISAEDAARTVAEILGIDLWLQTVPTSWAGDHPILLDARRLESRLGWRPKYTIREGIERTVAWLTRT